jgi:hypothetical protein
MWLTYLYFLLTVITCVQAIFKSSLRVGAAALIACSLCYFGTAGFVGSFRARDLKSYKTKELTGIAVIAIVLTAAGLALMTWSRFWIELFGVAIDGSYWALLGILIAAFTTKKEHAL